MSVVVVERDKTTEALLNGTSAQSRLRARVGEFAGDTKGNIMMTFGLMAFSLFGMVGSAVDIGRWLNARDQTVSAVDAAVLAAGRALQTNPADEAGAIAVATAYYNANKATRITTVEDTIGFAVTNDGGMIQATGNVKLKTYVLGIIDRYDNLGLKEIPLFADGETPQAIIKQEADIGFNREVSLMLDVSGSMGSGTKLADMKFAAKDLINLIMKDPGADTWTKVAVVPFSGDVRPPASILALAANPNTGATSGLWPTKRPVSSGGGGGGNGNLIVANNGNGNGGGSGGSTDYYYRTTCVAERTGTNAYTNEPPSAGNYVMPTYTKDSAKCSTPSSGEMAPLKNDKTAILSKIENLTIGGGTAGHLGTAWAYYFLSPEWNNVMPSSANHAAAYGTDKLKKIAILMTDGEYNYQYDSKGYSTGLSIAGNSANGLTSAQQAVQICSKMKEDGIEVYTVGFDLGGNQTAINTLASCASGSDHAYIADNGSALKSAFRDIAIKLTELHLLR
jgi:Flp pilus assembly protein TadG